MLFHSAEVPRHLPRPQLLACLAFVLAVAPLPFHHRTAHADLASGTVHYRAGWNLVAAPTGTVLEKATGQQFAFGPGSTDYQPVRRGEIIAGRAVFAFFPQDTDLGLGRTASEFTRTISRPDQWTLIGNPSSSVTLPITGADAALAYDSSRGYYAVTELAPGQGAWVLSHGGADIEVGKAATGALPENLRSLQAGLTQDAADVSNFAALPPVADALLKAHDYGQVQQAMDDLRSAFGDGLRLEHSAPLSGITAVQLDGLVRVREALARAQDAAAAGDLDSANRAVNEAQTVGQASEDDGVAVARARGSSGSLRFAGALLSVVQDTPAPSNLAAYGALCLAALPALGMALPPQPAFVQVVVATLTGAPIPPPAGASPAPHATTPLPQAAARAVLAAPAAAPAT